MNSDGKDFYLISYDIESDRRRNKVAKTLEGFGDRVQKSVFELNIDERQRERLEKRLQKLIDSETDSVRWYRLCADCRERISIQGVGVVSELPDAWVI